MNRARSWGRLHFGRLALGLLASCAARTPAPAPAPAQPVASAVITPQPPATPTVAPDGGRFLDAIPADLPPEVAQQLGVLSDLCNVAMHYEQEGAHRVRIGCRSCPPFDGREAVSDGRIAIDGKSFFELQLFLAGHFTAPDTEQRLAVFGGCSNRERALIAERQGDKFRALRYLAGFQPQSCKAYHRPDGRDLAVCELIEPQPSTSTDTLSVLDFAVDPPKQQMLLSFTNQEPCLTAPGTRSIEELIESFDVNQNPAAKNNGLMVRTTRTARDMDDRYQRYCRENVAGAAPMERPFSKPQLTTHQYRFDGESFVSR